MVKISRFGKTIGSLVLIPPTSHNSSQPNNPIVVRDLIDHSTKHWNRDLVTQHFEPQVATKILNIRIPLQGEDQLHWTLSKKGYFTVKSTYLGLTGALSEFQNHSPGSGDTWKKLWNLKTLPKVKLLLWKCLNDLLPTKVKLASFIEINSIFCSMCKSKPEDAKHLILECPFAKAIWFSLPFGFIPQLHSNLSLQEWILSWLQNNEINVNIDNLDWPHVAALVAWSIWKGRCFNVFQNKPLNTKSTSKGILYLLESVKTLNDCGQKLGINTNSSHIPSTNSKWTPPLGDFIKISCDASFDPSNLSCGIGLVARNNAGTFRGARVVACNAVDAENGESLTMWEAVKWAKEMHLQKIILESDSKQVISALKGDQTQVHWQNNTILKDCEYLLSNFTLWSLDI
ncbi:Reverse transcriptase zinc-binding domain [Macleaya cordata]|uniref:Reverse transcriptase zinc-binding domain n=1 Tax=Macleaya cordata TaxID=56857 RepID=A0A200Q0E5_MACCD|nr:Reverse transcriptase zinc-binding domain [Macleaya cordata]